jgi:hypothetical protein
VAEAHEEVASQPGADVHTAAQPTLQAPKAESWYSMADRLLLCQRCAGTASWS